VEGWASEKNGQVEYLDVVSYFFHLSFFACYFFFSVHTFMVYLSNARRDLNGVGRAKVGSGGFQEEERLGRYSIAQFLGVLGVVPPYCHDLLACLPEFAHFPIIVVRHLRNKPLHTCLLRGRKGHLKKEQKKREELEKIAHVLGTVSVSHFYYCPTTLFKKEIGDAWSKSF
jgi:hypothetical protein